MLTTAGDLLFPATFSVYFTLRCGSANAGNAEAPVVAKGGEKMKG